MAEPTNPSPRSFKGWTIPGPGVGEIPGLTDSALAAYDPETETLDALCGNYKIFQLKKGHRFSTDDLLVAWYGTLTCPSAVRVLDLGSGIGSVGMTAAWRLPGARFVTIEAQERSVSLARRSCRFNGLERRYEIRQGDFRDPALLGVDERFDLVTGSPPYFPLEAGLHGDHPQKVACRFEVRGDVADYCRIARAHLAPGGVFACVFPIQPEAQAERVREACAAAGLIVLRERPVELKEGEPALLSVFAMGRREDFPPSLHAPAWREPPLVIRTRHGQVAPEYSRVKLSIGFPP